MSSENETVAEIVSKVRSGDYGCAKCGDLCDCHNADKIIASIADRFEAAHRREMNQLSCNARDGEGSSLRVGWEGEKEYCVVAKYTKDLQEELEDYDYHRVTGPLTFDNAKHWLDFHRRIRMRSGDSKILVRDVSKWRELEGANSVCDTALAAIR